MSILFVFAYTMKQMADGPRTDSPGIVGKVKPARWEYRSLPSLCVSLFFFLNGDVVSFSESASFVRWRVRKVKAFGLPGKLSLVPLPSAF